MDATEILRGLGSTPSNSGEAIRQIVEVFEDGYRAAAALRHTADELSAVEIEAELNSIELRMVWEISSICERFARDGFDRSKGGTGQPVAVQ